jgi:hypothetical protein
VRDLAPIHSPNYKQLQKILRFLEHVAFFGAIAIPDPKIRLLPFQDLENVYSSFCNLFVNRKVARTCIGQHVHLRLVNTEIRVLNGVCECQRRLSCEHRIP